MAKIIAFADQTRQDQMVWVHPDAVELVRANPNGGSVIYFRSATSPIYVGGEPDFVVSKLNAASD